MELLTDAKTSIRFFVNGTEVVEENPDPEMTLLYYLRNKMHLTGTKLGCGEGGCGACTVMVSKYIASTDTVVNMSVNSCLAPLCSVDEAAITTVEGIGSTRTGLHPCQERIARSHGSQCGFCTPGIVMSMYTLLRNDSQPSQETMEQAFQGNLCRCTGYRPILDGYSTLCCKNGSGCCSAPPKTEGATVTGSGVLSDHSKFRALDPTQEPIFPPQLKLQGSPRPLAVVTDRVSWFRPVSLQELLALRDRYPHHKERNKPQYRLVVGNTEIGVEVRLKGQFYPVMIAPDLVPEFHRLELIDEGLLVGAAVTLASLDSRLQQLMASLPRHKTQVFEAMLEMLRWFAGPQIRNVSSLTGNIMTASPISDLNPVLLAVRARLDLASVDGRRSVEMDDNFFTGYRQTCLRPNEVLVSVLIPFTAENDHVAAYKQARRRDDDIAIVNGCFAVCLHDDGTVDQCRLAFGGMSYITIVASDTQAKLKGRKWDKELLLMATTSLASELSLKPDVPGGMPDYRVSLALSFFYKYYLKVLSSRDPSAVPETHLSAYETFHRETSRGSQGFQRVPSTQLQEDVVGRPLMHLSAEKQASGEAHYTDDMPRLEGELYAGLVLSEKAHAKFVLDSGNVEKLKSCKAFVTVKDVPGSNIIGSLQDEHVFADGEVTSVGQIIAMVIADDKLTAQRLAKMVKVNYEDLPPVLTIEDAIEAQQFFPKVLHVSRGDADGVLANADNILEGKTRTGAQEHFYLETNACIAIPKGEDQEMEIILSTQAAHLTQIDAAKVLGIPANRIVVRVKRIGGGFGGKETRTASLSTALAVAAHKVQAPVRIMLDRNEDMLMTGQRHPFLGEYKVSYTDKGKITALKLHLYSNAGYSADLSIPVMERAVLHSTNAYFVEHAIITGHVCRTNLPSNTAFRGFGGPQAMMIMENIIDHISSTLGMDPVKVREVNLCQQECETVYCLPISDCHLPRCWDLLLERSEYYKRRTSVESFNRNNRWKKRGIAIIPTMYGISFGFRTLNQAGALVHVYTDGSVLLTHGGTEMGQGLHTKMVQVCARCLSVPVEMIHFSETATDKVPNSSPTAASSSTDLYGMAVKNACDQISDRLQPYKLAEPEAGWKKWVGKAYFDRVNLSAQGFFKTPGLDFEWSTGRGRPYRYYTYGVGCSEVQVDCLTGDFHVLRSDLLMDVGDSINPAIDIGQVEGAFTQGMGLFTMEECVFLRDGKLFTTGPGSYKIPGFSDIPVELNVTLLDRAPNPDAIFSSKAVGEPPLFLAASVFFAIKDAIGFARSDSGHSPVFSLHCPATAEHIRMACQDQFTAMVEDHQRSKYGEDRKTWDIVP